ncbi:hypothetical protein [Jiangella alkaliphila]|uniref:Uncharacterized protein n=1 Tax=Jiangella alkaliphila TaxID=419479 RepID=A0A1H2M2P3_9ACTN|nr:hypothetical protein [Jiangella alkaliphila]SDU87510.1 hypothetical protein SAMN04488563_6999 [Jiangella alkaliphila]
MNEFDDELRRLLGDDRLALTPRADAVDRIVRGARRRRAARLAATTVGSVGMVAALTVGSFAVADQFTAGPDAVGPAGTPSGATDDPTTPAPTTTTPAEPVMVYPNEGIDGLTVGTKLADLENLDGVEITRFEPEDGYTELCYGEYRSANAHGYISTRGTFGVTPDDLNPYYEVSTMHFDVPVATPEGITPGSSESDLLAAYPNLDLFGKPDNGHRATFEGEDIIVRGWEFTMAGGVVTEIMMEGLQQCHRAPILDPPTGGDEGGEGDETGEEPQDPPAGTEPPNDETGADEGTETGTETPGGETDASWRVEGEDIFAPIRLGMTLTELQAVDGVVITPMEDEFGVCHSRFELGDDVSGWVSVRSDWVTEAERAESDDDYRVTAVTSLAAGLTTPLGIGPGSTIEQVREAYPDVREGDTFDPFVADPGNPAVRWIFLSSDGETVSGLGLDAGQICAG